MIMIKTEKLTKLFATEEVQTKALNEVTLQVEQGEFVRSEEHTSELQSR